MFTSASMYLSPISKYTSSKLNKKLLSTIQKGIEIISPDLILNFAS